MKDKLSSTCLKSTRRFKHLQTTNTHLPANLLDREHISPRAAVDGAVSSVWRWERSLCGRRHRQLLSRLGAVAGVGDGRGGAGGGPRDSSGWGRTFVCSAAVCSNGDRSHWPCLWLTVTTWHADLPLILEYRREVFQSKKVKLCSRPTPALPQKAEGPLGFGSVRETSQEHLSQAQDLQNMGATGRCDAGAGVPGRQGLCVPRCLPKPSGEHGCKFPGRKTPLRAFLPVWETSYAGSVPC